MGKLGNADRTAEARELRGVKHLHVAYRRVAACFPAGITVCRRQRVGDHDDLSLDLGSDDRSQQDCEDEGETDADTALPD